MTDRASDAPVSAEIARDLDALAAESHHELPSLDRSLTAARRRRRAAPRWKELLMPVTTGSRRPWLATAAALLLVLAAAMFPISWQATVGHDVALTLTGVRDVAQASGIAREMKSVLGADHVAVRATAGGPTATLAFTAYVPAGHGVDAAARAQALAAALRSRGFAATATATPRRAQVAGPVYAYARDLVIRVETDGKTAAQIESEIRDRLAAAGLTNTTVSVTDDGARREVKVTAESHTPGEGAEGVKLQLTKDGKPIDDRQGVRIEMRRMRSSAGEMLHLDVTDHGRTTAIEIPHADAMSDAALESEIESRLRAAGFDLVVTVTNGRVSIEDRH